MNQGTEPTEVRRMHCMEVSGGTKAVEEAVAMPGLDGWVYSRPFEDARTGGDVYYISVCGGGIISRFIVADVSGHGEAVAEFSGSLRTLMRKYINTKSQTRLVGALNREFAAMAEFSHFATAIVATYLATHCELTVCNAGHPRPLFYSAADGNWMILDRNVGQVGNLPLGLDDETQYNQFTTVLGPGDLVVLYTDALTEAADPSGHLLGEDGLLEQVRALDPTEPHMVGLELLNAIEEFRAGRPSDDDVTLLVLYHNGNGPRRLTVGEKLDVYAKVFGLKGY